MYSWNSFLIGLFYQEPVRFDVTSSGFVSPCSPVTTTFQAICGDLQMYVCVLIPLVVTTSYSMIILPSYVPILSPYSYWYLNAWFSPSSTYLLSSLQPVLRRLLHRQIPAELVLNLAGLDALQHLQ